MENRLLAGSLLSFASKRSRSVPWEVKLCTCRLLSPAPRKVETPVLWLGLQANAGMVGAPRDSPGQPQMELVVEGPEMGQAH